MNVLFIVLNKTEFLDDILDEFFKIGLSGATILESQGMGSAIYSSRRDNELVFGSVRAFIDSSRPYNKTIFTVIQDDQMLEDAIQAVKTVLGDMGEPGVGMMFTMPVGSVYGI